MASFSLSMFLLGFIMHRLYLLSLLEYPAGPSTDERVLLVTDHDSTQLTCPCIGYNATAFFHKTDLKTSGELVHTSTTHIPNQKAVAEHCLKGCRVVSR